MTVEQALAILDAALKPEYLNNVQELVFRQAWDGQTYEQIASASGYDADYIRHVGSQLWKLLSKALAEEVTKSNLRSVLQRRASLEQGKQAELGEKSLLTPTIPNRTDWGEAVDVPVFYGRTQELARLEQWIVSDCCRLVAILGMGGMGKSALALKLAQQVQNRFEFLIWRCLRNAPPIEQLLSELIQFLSNQQYINLPNTKTGISQLIDYLRSSRCLVILDNAEAILQGGELAGYYREGYEGYGELLKKVGEIPHQSAIVLTSREKPKEVALLEGATLPVRSWQLTGLKTSEAEKILVNQGCFGETQASSAVIQHYAGNPLALKMVAAAVRDVFSGNLSQFLEFIRQGNLVFGDIRDLLDRQFNRLSAAEKEVMYWLAINREPVTFVELHSDIVTLETKRNLLDTLTSLDRRFLVEKSTLTLGENSPIGFTQQPVVMEYMTERLLERVGVEIVTEIELFASHALIKAQAKDYVRESQVRVILEPLASKLYDDCKSRKNIEDRFKRILLKLREEPSISSGYGGGNAINLLSHLKIDLTNYDFSSLVIRQADLRGILLHGVKFTRSSFVKSAFLETLGGVIAVAFSPDGNLLATGDVNGELRLWQVTDGKQLLAIKAHAGWTLSVAFSPNGNTLVSSGVDYLLKLWDVNTGECLQTFHGHKDAVWSVAFSPQGNIIASGSIDQSVKLWDAIALQCLKTLQGHTGQVYSVTFSPDGQILASGSEDSTVKLWNYRTGECLKTLQGHTGQVHSVAFSPDGQIASGSEDSTVKLWNYRTGKCLKTLQGHCGPVHSVAFSLGGILASGSYDQTVKLWDVDKGECLRTLPGHKSKIWSVAFSPKGQILASGSFDQTVRLWDIRTSQCLKTLQGYTEQVHAVAFSSDGQTLASGSEVSTVHLWDVSQGHSLLRTLHGHCSAVWSIAFSPQGNILASGSYDKTLKLWDISKGQCLKTLHGHTEWIISISFSPQGIAIATGSFDKTVKLWNVSTGECMKTLHGHDHAVWSVAFSPQGNILASGSHDQVVKLWDVNTGECLKTLQGHTAWIGSVAFSSDGRTLASGSNDKTVKLWNVSTGECLKTLQGHTSWIWSVACSPQGNIVASGSYDQTVRLWDIHTGECLKTLQGHTAWVQSVAFSPDGCTLASGSVDETVKLWDVQTGECLQTLRAPRPYEGMKIVGVKGLTEATIATLKALGAVELD